MNVLRIVVVADVDYIYCLVKNTGHNKSGAGVVFARFLQLAVWFMYPSIVHTVYEKKKTVAKLKCITSNAHTVLRWFNRGNRKQWCT